MASDAEKPGVSSAEAIFTAALTLPSAERPAYLMRACPDDEQLRLRVEALLRANDAPEGFLPELPGVPAGEILSPANIVPASLTEQPGDMIGRYKLRQKIGEGGCGVVYLAEQEQPVRRKVALKIIKLGMDTKQVVARFEAERQALAMMDHANIARVLDAGATETGRPYFVMELVGGIKITDFCNQNNLDIRQRLDLFIQVCRAIQHAHQKGIIHRDIKPSNVLVAIQDGVLVPKVIDFGIAKATQGRLTDQTVFTAFEQFLGTPAYMSPEQAQLGGLDVDTRSDIYSLGVLLYELLTGKTPFDSKELLAAGLDAMRRTILEKEPLTPSTRLKQEIAARSAGSDKSALHTPHSALDKDLDWIVMKCLEKDRARRYETANGLAHDVERYLASEPVSARPPSRFYSLKKLLRRNKLIVTAAAAIFFVLLLGLGGIFSQWRRAEEHATLERNERSRAQMALTQMEAIQVRRAEEYFQAGDRRNMLTYLALVLRQNPSNRIAAERLFSTLSHRNWARLACPPLMHSSRVTSAMFSRDGRRVVTSSADHTAWVWDPSTGQRVAGPLTHNAEINTAEFSPDGRFVVTASDDQTARVWDAQTGQPVTNPLPHPARVALARFTPDSQEFVTLCDDRVARLWDARTGRSVLKPLLHGNGPPQWDFFKDADFSPDGALLAIAAKEEGTVRVWSRRTGQIAYELKHGTSHVYDVHFSPDGQRLAAAFHTNLAVVWNLASDPPQSVMLPQEGELLGIEFSPDGQRAITTSTAGTAQVWNAINGKAIGPALKHNDKVRGATFSPDGLRVVTAAHDQTIRVWDAESGEPLLEPMQVENRAYYAKFHPDGQRVLSASNGNAVLIWWITGSSSLAVHEQAIDCFEFSNDGDKIVIGTEAGWTRIWEPLTGRPPVTLSEGSAIRSVIFSPDGSYVATGSSNGTVRVWFVATGQPVTKSLKMDKHSDIASLQFTRDNKRLVAFNRNGVAQIWDVAKGEPASPPLDDGTGVIAARISPDGKWVATGNTNHTARLWNMTTGRSLGELMRHDGSVRAVCFSPDGKKLLTASADRTARLWAIPSGAPIGAPIRHSLDLWRVHFDRNGDRFLTGAPAKPSVWDSATAKLLIEIPADGSNEAEFTADGQRIAAAFGIGSRTCEVWDIQTGGRLSEPLGREPSLMRVSPNGRFLAAYSDCVRIWEITPPPLPVPPWLAELAEALAGQRVNQQGLVEPVSPQELWIVQEKLRTWGGMLNGQELQLPSGAELYSKADLAPDSIRNFYSRWAKWFISPPNSRSVLPSASLTPGQYAQTGVQWVSSPPN